MKAIRSLSMHHIIHCLSVPIVGPISIPLPDHMNMTSSVLVTWGDSKFTRIHIFHEVVAKATDRNL